MEKFSIGTTERNCAVTLVVIMTETTNVWVRTAALEKAITGKAAKEIRRGLPTAEEDEIVDWGWAYATVKQQNENFIEIFIQDEDSPHHGMTVNLPPDSLSKREVLPGNKYQDEDEFDEGNEEGQYPDDLIVLTHLHEAEVVHCLRKRYTYDKIYTSTGPILLALNPFKNCKQLYSNKVMAEYWARGELFSKGVVDEQNPLPPHVYGIADRSFRIMMQTLEENKGGTTKRGPGKATLSDQSILVSGESGAGKTVTTKFIMQYLATLSQRSTGGEIAKTESGGQTIEQQVLQSNPILESFGNARTIRNDNSSRFGKFIEIKFNKGALVGASVETYLLEKVRLISQAEGERNYHIFYELFCMGDEELEHFHMGIYNPEDFNMTNRSGTYDRRDGVEDFETFDDLKRAMTILGLTDEMLHNILTIPAAAMHASNVTFIAKSSDESELDTANPHLKPFLELMGLSKQDLETSLCFLQIKAGREYHMRTLPKEKAQKGMEALIKAFYGSLFTFLVGQINSSITVKESSGTRRRVGSATANPDEATIGVLDIFGFESFKHNSFEQLCINYCNEALQQQFNLFVLKNEQAEYDKEGIAWSFISFPDNQDVLDLIDKKGCGMLNILDDQCRAPGTTDKTFCIDIYKKCTGHPRFEADFRQVGAQKFGVRHYAGPVEYDTKGFVEKNKDELPKEATDLLLGSTKEIVRELASILNDPTGSGGDARARSISPSRPSATTVKVTVGSQFSKQLRDLRAKIDLTSPHYVRCLKPNDLLLPDHFNPLIISDQLRYAGVIEAVRVSRVGYPHRYPHNAFVTRYRILALAELKKAQRTAKRTKPVDVVVRVIALKIWRIQGDKENAADGDATGGKKEDEPPNLMSVGVQVGKTKVFLRRNAYDIIEQLRSGKNAESAVVIQKYGRRYISRREFVHFRRGIVALQCAARMKAAKSLVHEMRLNHRSTQIQSMWRRGVQHERYFATRAVVKWVQRHQRGREGRRRYEALNRQRKAILLQRYWRGFVARKDYNRARNAAVAIQCSTRCRIARRSVKNLRLQARDLNSAVSERDHLRREAQLLRQQLKEAQNALDKSAAQAISTGASEELEAAQCQIKQLLADAELMKEELKKIKDENKEQKCVVASTQSAIKESEAKAEEQLLRAEKYKKRFIEYHEQVKKLKEDELKNEREVNDLRIRLEAANRERVEGVESERETRKALEVKLAKAENDLAIANLLAIDVSKDFDRVKQERDLLAAEVEAASSLQSTAATEVSSAELNHAKEVIRDLERQLATANSGVSMDEFESLRDELSDVQEQATADLQRKNAEIAILKNELTQALKTAPNGTSRTVNDEEGALIALSLKEEVKRLKEELALKKTQSAGEIDPNSPAALAQRYEELRRLAEAGLEKDREIEKLRIRIKQIESEGPTLEQNNTTEEGEALRLYIDELQKEISNLRENAAALRDQSENNDRGSLDVGKKSSLLSKMMHGNSSHGPVIPAHDLADDVEGRINDLEDEAEALKEVNLMLRQDVEKSRKKIKELESDLREEKETSKRELESFARTLRGVDELRSAAESMSRQVNQFKSHTPIRRRGSAGRGFTDEVVDDFDGQLEESVKMIEAEGKRFEHVAAEKLATNKPHRFWGIDLMGGNRPTPSADVPIGEELDQVDEDIRKIMLTTKRKIKKKKRRGSGNSIVSSFF